MAIDVQERLRQLGEVPQAAGLQEIGADPVQRTARQWSDPVAAGLSYFRIPDARMPRGRVELGHNGANSLQRTQRRGHVLLTRYGEYKSANQGSDWQLQDPLLGLVQLGGLAELDPGQLHDMKWHHRPERTSPQTHHLVWAQIQRHLDAGVDRESAILAVLPQLDGLDLDEHRCEYCKGRTFATVGQRDSHASIMHKAEVQTLGTRDAVAAALTASGGNQGALIDAITLLVQQMAATQAAAAEPAKRGPGRPPKDATSDDA